MRLNVVIRPTPGPTAVAAAAAAVAAQRMALCDIDIGRLRLQLRRHSVTVESEQETSRVAKKVNERRDDDATSLGLLGISVAAAFVRLLAIETTFFRP